MSSLTCRAGVVTLALLSLLASPADAQGERPMPQPKGGSPGGLLARAVEAARPGAVRVDESGVLLDAWELAIPAGPDLISAVDQMVSDSGDLLAPPGAPALELAQALESLTGRHLRYRQRIEGAEVVGGELTVDVDTAGTIRELHNRMVTGVRIPARLSTRQAIDALVQTDAHLLGLAAECADSVWIPDGGLLRSAYRLVFRKDPLKPWAYYVDATRGTLLRSHPLFATARGRVFDPNPVVVLNDPSLRDHDDSPSAVPDAAYSTVDLLDLPASGPLTGPNVAIVDLEVPFTTPADAGQSLLFDRSQDQFEDVMAYYHLDRSQRYLQSLGYVGVRRIIDHPVRVDAHAANGRDESFYVPDAPGQGSLHFGTGGTDDAEDADILLHEYGHAIQDWIAPGVFLATAEARAIGEGFGDYWSFSSNYAATIATGRDPYCIADWDARCAGDDPSKQCAYAVGADCLRRVDSGKTIADYVVGGDDHVNGEIWSSALREIFMNLTARAGVDQGRRTADAIVIEGHFGAPVAPTFSTMARKMIAADVLLNHGANVPAICSAMTSRGILAPQDCSTTPRGELTFFQSSDQNLAIPDNDPRGLVSKRIVTDGRSIDKVYVGVDIQHPYIGDLRVVLHAPDGAAIVLQDASASVAAHDIHSTFGLDAQPAQPLDVLHGRPAAGEWSLEVVDTRPRDAGVLLSWNLQIEFVGDAPFAARPLTGAVRKHIPAVGHTPGAEGTLFVSDVRIYNGGPETASTTAVFTPSGVEGNANFAAVRLSIAPGQIVALDDIVGRTFRTSGTGNLELQGAVSNLLVTSRTYNQAPSGTYGQFIPSADTSDAVGREGPVVIPQLQNNDNFRTNIGFTEVAGRYGTVLVDLFDGAHQLLQHVEYPLDPFGHLQVPILGGRTGEHHDAVFAQIGVAGDARILAYGSVIDNRSGDPIFIPARRRPVFSPPVITTGPLLPLSMIPAVIHADGANGTHWRTDLWLTNAEAAPQTIALHYEPAVGGPGGNLTMLELGAGEMRKVDDVVQSLFQATGIGHVTIYGLGPVIATSRTWTPSDNGTYGQFIPGRPVDDGAALTTPPRQMIQLESSAAYRTNVGATEIGGKPGVVRFTVYDAAGRAIATSDQPLPAWGLTQLNVRQFAPADLTDGRVAIQLVSGNALILGYASVIDNRTGDPIYIPSQ